MLHLADGHVTPLPLHDGRLPRELPERPADIDRITVELSIERLRSLQVIDTPGLNTTSSELEAASLKLLGVAEGALEESTRTAVGQVDALLFVLPHLRARDAEVLRTAGRLLGGTALSGLNTIGVLSRIDRLSADDVDPWPPARQLAERLHEQLRDTVSTVVPVIGLLAETVACGSLTEADAAAVRTMADLTAAQRDDVLGDAAALLTSPVVALPERSRRRLYDLLSLHGIRVALAVAESGPATASTIRHALEEASGFGALVTVLDRQVVARADLLTAHVALAELRRLSYAEAAADDASVLRGLRDPLERLELDSELHRLRLLEALALSFRGDLRLPAARREELQLLALAVTPAERLGAAPDYTDEQLVERALDASAEWVRLSNDARRSPAERSAARAVRTALELLVSDLGRPRDREAS
jgi:hypothetical protein